MGELNYPFPHALYCDGGLIGSNGNVEVGTYTWLQVDITQTYLCHESGLVTGFNGRPVENNMVELVALLRGLRSLPETWSGTVFSDNVNALGWAGLIRKRDGSSYKSDGVPDDLKRYLPKALARLGKIKGVHLDGHPTPAELAKGIGHRGNPVSIFNQMCDDHCKAERVKYSLLHKTGGAFKLTQAEYMRLTERTKQELAALGYSVSKTRTEKMKAVITDEEADRLFEEALAP